MSRWKIIVIALFIFSFSTPFIDPSTAAPTVRRTGPATDGSSYSTGPHNEDITALDIMEDIEKAQAILRCRKSGYTERIKKTAIPYKDRRGKTRTRIVRTRIVEPAFLLAVQDLKDRRIKLVRYTSKGCVTDGFEIIMTRKNGVASRFEIVHPRNMAILALRTMVRHKTKGHEEVVYTPYAPEIDTPEIRQAGLNYLRKRIETARADLEEANVQLKGFDALPDAFSLTDIALALSIIEHIDPVRYKNCPAGEETTLVNEVLTIIGANKAKAYDYSRSSMGARGLFQFIPGTYEKILRKYPGAGLKKDFVAGCTDHVNAAKASLLLFDSDLNDLPGDYLRHLSRDATALGRYLAAAYNCGSKRVERSLKNCSSSWTRILPEETRTYLRKFDTVWNMRALFEI
jgi:hypothetical protein